MTQQRENFQLKHHIPMQAPLISPHHLNIQNLKSFEDTRKISKPQAKLVF